MSLEENLQTHWKEKYAHQDEEQNSEADIPNFELVSWEDERRMRKTGTTKTTRVEN